MVGRTVKLKLEIECLGFENCEFGKEELWGIKELCYYFNHCDKKDSYKTCRFYQKGDKEK